MAKVTPGYGTVQDNVIVGKRELYKPSPPLQDVLLPNFFRPPRERGPNFFRPPRGRVEIFSGRPLLSIVMRGLFS